MYPVTRRSPWAPGRRPGSGASACDWARPTAAGVAAQRPPSHQPPAAAARPSSSTTRMAIIQRRRRSRRSAMVGAQRPRLGCGRCRRGGSAPSRWRRVRVAGRLGVQHRVAGGPGSPGAGRPGAPGWPAQAPRSATGTGGAGGRRCGTGTGTRRNPSWERIPTSAARNAVASRGRAAGIPPGGRHDQVVERLRCPGRAARRSAGRRSARAGRPPTSGCRRRTAAGR